MHTEKLLLRIQKRSDIQKAGATPMKAVHVIAKIHKTRKNQKLATANQAIRTIYGDDLVSSQNEGKNEEGRMKISTDFFLERRHAS
jgi:hypothetical protein